MGTRYVWKKYSIKTTTEYQESTAGVYPEDVKIPYSSHLAYFKISNTYTFDSSTGTYSLGSFYNIFWNPNNGAIINGNSLMLYAMQVDSSATNAAYLDSTTMYVVSASLTDDINYTYWSIAATDGEFIYFVALRNGETPPITVKTRAQTTVQERGDLIGTVTGASASLYPTNGISGSYTGTSIKAATTSTPRR